MTRLRDTVGLPIYLGMAAYAFLTGPDKFIDSAKDKAERGTEKISYIASRFTDDLGDAVKWTYNKPKQWLGPTTPTTDPFLPPAAPTGPSGTAAPRGYLPRPGTPVQPAIPGPAPSESAPRGTLPPPGASAPATPRSPAATAPNPMAPTAPTYGGARGRLPYTGPSTTSPTESDSLVPRRRVAGPVPSTSNVWTATPRKIRDEHWVIDDATGQNPPDPYYFGTEAHARDFIDIVNGFAQVYTELHPGETLSPSLVPRFAKKIDLPAYNVISAKDFILARKKLTEIQANPAKLEELLN